MKTYIYLPYLLFDCLIYSLWSCSIYYNSLVPRPPLPPPPAERPGTHCLYMLKIFQYIFRKKLCGLPCPYAEHYTNQEYRAFFKIDSSDNLTYRTLLEYFSDELVSFFQT